MEVVDDVRQIIAKTLKIPVEQLTPDTRLEDIGAQSLDVIEIVFELEEKFGITIPFKADGGTQPSNPGNGEDLPFTTIGEVAGVVKGLIDAQAAS